MKHGVAADHGGYEMKEKIYILLGAYGHEVVDFGNFVHDSGDDYPVVRSLDLLDENAFDRPLGNANMPQ